MSAAASTEHIAELLQTHSKQVVDYFRSISTLLPNLDIDERLEQTWNFLREGTNMTKQLRGLLESAKRLCDIVPVSVEELSDDLVEIEDILSAISKEVICYN